MDISIIFENPNITVVCECVEDANGIVEHVLTLGAKPARVVRTAAPRVPRRASRPRRPAAAVDALASAVIAPTAPRTTRNKGGRKPSQLALDVFQAIAKNPKPNLESLAASLGAPSSAVRGIVRRAVMSGRLRPLRDGGWKVVSA